MPKDNSNQADEKFVDHGSNGDEFDDELEVHREFVGAFRLEQYLKAFNIAASGGQAKVLIQSGQVRVNGKVEIRRKRQLKTGDTVQFLGDRWVVE